MTDSDRTPAANVEVLTQSPSDKKDNATEKAFSSLDGIIFIAVTCIGSGMFFAPGEAAQAVGSPCGAILAFVFAGVLSLFGGLCYSELGTAFISTGAESHYLKRAFGEGSSFAFTWTTFMVIGSGAVAGITTVSAKYFAQALNYDPEVHTDLVTYTAVALLTGLVAINLLIPQHTSKINKLMMAIKISSSLFVLIGAISGPGDRSDTFMNNDGQGCWANTDPTGFVTAVVFALFAMAGWSFLGPLSAELRNPSKDIPRIYSGGMALVTLVSILFNVSFFISLPKSSMQTSLAAPFAEAVAGKPFVVIISVMASLFCLGSSQAVTMSVSRILYSAAKAGNFPSVFARTAGPKHVPVVALLAFWAWTSLVMLTMNLGKMVVFYTMGQWFFFVLVSVGLLRLRKLEPNVERPYKVASALPVIFIVTSVGILVQQTFLKESVFKVEVSALNGFLIIIAGYIVYYLKDMFYRHKAAAMEADAGIDLTEKPVQ